VFIRDQQDCVLNRQQACYTSTCTKMSNTAIQESADDYETDNGIISSRSAKSHNDAQNNRNYTHKAPISERNL